MLPAADPTALSGRRVVITGAGRGLGRALAIVMADAGAQTTLLGRDPAKLRQVAEAIQARTGQDPGTIPCDLGSPDSVRQACRRVLEAAPVVDILVNNAAPYLSGALAQLSDIDIAATVAAGATGTLLVTKGVLPGLRKSKAADVVTIVSTSGLPGRSVGPTSAAFTASKFAQAGFSEQLRAEVKPEGIRVTAIYPPDFDDTDPLGPEWQEVRGPDPGQRLTNREVVAAVLFAVTAPRVCTYSDIVLGNTWRPGPE